MLGARVWNEVDLSYYIQKVHVPWVGLAEGDTFSGMGFISINQQIGWLRVADLLLFLPQHLAEPVDILKQCMWWRRWLCSEGKHIESSEKLERHLVLNYILWVSALRRDRRPENAFKEETVNRPGRISRMETEKVILDEKCPGNAGVKKCAKGSQ